MEVKKETKYTISLSQEEMNRLIQEMNTIYPLFASEGDVTDIHMLLHIKDELAMMSRNDE